MKEVIELLQQQIACQKGRHEEQMIEFRRRQNDKTKLLQETIATRPRSTEAQVAKTTQVAATSNVTAFGSLTELWKHGRRQGGGGRGPSPCAISLVKFCL